MAWARRAAQRRGLSSLLIGDPRTAACERSSTADLCRGEPAICMRFPVIINLEAKPTVTASLLRPMAGRDLSRGGDLDYCLGAAQAAAAAC